MTHQLFVPQMSGAGIPMQLPSGLGVGMPIQDALTLDPARVVERLGAKWWHNWGYGDPVIAGKQLMWWGPVWPRLDGTIESAIESLGKAPGQAMLVGNEPDLMGDPVETWATRMRSLDQSIGTGYWGGMGTIICTAGLDWLTRYLKAGGPVPDVWMMHLYALFTPAGAVSTDDVSRMDLLWNLWTDWYGEYGAGKPIIINEFAGSANSAQEHRDCMRWAVDLLRSDRPVRPVAVAWFCSRYIDTWDNGVHKFESSWLIGPDEHLTELGVLFRELANG